MEPFRLLHRNLIATTTSLLANTGTNTVASLIDRDSSTQWASVGYTGATAATIIYTVPLGANTTVARFFIRNCNWGTFRVFYDGVTASVFSPDMNAASNTAENLYFEVSTQTVSSITFQINTTFPLGSEKLCGEIYIGDTYVDFPQNPSFERYNPLLYRKGRDLEMADGGMVSIYLDQKFRADIELGFVSETNRDLFRACYDAHQPIYFIPYSIDGFTTTSQWKGEAAECVWTGDFNFLRLSSDSLNNGFFGLITLAETPDR